MSTTKNAFRPTFDVLEDRLVPTSLGAYYNPFSLPPSYPSFVQAPAPTPNVNLLSSLRLYGHAGPFQFGVDNSGFFGGYRMLGMNQQNQVSYSTDLQQNVAGRLGISYTPTYDRTSQTVQNWMGVYYGFKNFNIGVQFKPYSFSVGSWNLQAYRPAPSPYLYFSNVHTLSGAELNAARQDELGAAQQDAQQAEAARRAIDAAAGVGVGW